MCVGGVNLWTVLVVAEKIQLILPTITVASGGTKIVPCLLPRLQHWQHDVAIHSQYCISLAFCEEVAANLSPHSTPCQWEEGSSRGMGWSWVRPVVATPQLFLRWCVFPLLVFKTHCPCQCVMGENQSHFCGHPCVIFPLCWYLVSLGGEGLNGNGMVVTIKL